METKSIPFLFLLVFTLLVGCGSRPYSPGSAPGEIGYASWYGDKFHGRPTASGEQYDMYHFTAAHRTAPFGTRFRVVNLENDKSVVVRINDRGPFVRGRIIDLSLTAAREIDLIRAGTAKVRLEYAGRVVESTQYLVQAGSFRDLRNAEQMAETVSERLPGWPVEVKSVDGLNRVYFGPFADEAKAAKLVGLLRKEGISAFVLRR